MSSQGLPSIYILFYLKFIQCDSKQDEQGAAEDGLSDVAGYAGKRRNKIPRNIPKKRKFSQKEMRTVIILEK